MSIYDCTFYACAEKAQFRYVHNIVIIVKLQKLKNFSKIHSVCIKLL